MSGIYIPNIELPKGANDCEFSDEFFTCSLTEERCALERMGIGCPLVFVPDHGRLIDADTMTQKAFEMRFGNRISEYGLFVLNRAIKEMPTIIQADKEKE